jgi:periplasmic divalent cation tolerance protein
MSTTKVLIVSTCPDQETAENIARLLVSEKLAACVNILPNIRSIYSWQGQIESASELLLLIKATDNNYLAIENLIKSVHPYECPEIIAISIVKGSPEYLNWIDSCHL